MDKLIAIINEFFTDAKGRPEVKNYIGIPATAIGIVFGLARLCGAFSFSMAEWAIYMGVASGLIVVTAVQDGFLDKKGKE